MHGLLWCVFVLYCAKPSPRSSRIPGKPGPLRSMVIIGSVRPQISIYARETSPFGGFATLNASQLNMTPIFHIGCFLNVVNSVGHKSLPSCGWRL